MHFYMGAIALDTVRERQLEGERFARLLPAGLPRGRGGPRRWLARLAAGVSRASASVARRLDEHVALTDARPST
jgi:hypothetical protein